MLTTGNQLKAARILAEIEQKELAVRAGFNVNTIRNMESAAGGPIAGRAANVQIVQRILEGMGVEFLNHGRPGVRLITATRQPVDTNGSETIQYPEFKDGDGGPGSGG